jgi:hypothetical protein
MKGLIDTLHPNPSTSSLLPLSFLEVQFGSYFQLNPQKKKKKSVTLQYADQLLTFVLLAQCFNNLFIYLFAIPYALPHFCMRPTDLNLMRG